MKIEEAIERLNGLEIPLRTKEDHSNFDAIQLGIEALKFKQNIRAHTVDDFDALLPGESE